jgi:hypothetical protein
LNDPGLIADETYRACSSRSKLTFSVFWWMLENVNAPLSNPRQSESHETNQIASDIVFRHIRPEPECMKLDPLALGDLEIDLQFGETRVLAASRIVDLETKNTCTVLYNLRLTLST